MQCEGIFFQNTVIWRQWVFFSLFSIFLAPNSAKSSSLRGVNFTKNRCVITIIIDIPIMKKFWISPPDAGYTLSLISIIRTASKNSSSFIQFLRETSLINLSFVLIFEFCFIWLPLFSFIIFLAYFLVLLFSLFLTLVFLSGIFHI